MTNGIGYNRGDKYEDLIHQILFVKKLTNLPRAGAGGGVDLSINKYKDRIINIEVKSEGADYGQKELNYKDEQWIWSNPDPVTDFYDQMDVIGMIDPDFVPKNINHHNLPKNEWAEKRKVEIGKYEFEYDGRFQKNKIPLSLDAFFKYYEIKDCYYIQIDGSGFYHLSEDKFNLGTSQYDGKIHLRLRRKTNHAHWYFINGKRILTRSEFLRKKLAHKDQSVLLEDEYKIIKSPWDYVFQAVIKQNTKPTLSEFGLDKKLEQRFPSFD
jgi:hypothetical protein